jgi:hypothetical protein
MQNLKVINQHFTTYADNLFTIDVLGGVDLSQIEKMICTLRITHKNYPPFRTTLDLYIDNQVDKLIRTLCDKYGVTLLEVSKSTHEFIRQLESYKLERLRYPQGDRDKDFEMSEDEENEAKKYLTDKKLISNLQTDLQKIGILGEEENALILFLAMASHKSNNPFSVLCLAKSGIGKSYLLQKLSACMPKNSFSFHTQISENALYYFDNQQIDGKVLFIEDLEWTNAMLMPLATLQTQGKLIKTRATKDKDGMLHSTTFEVAAKLCLIACAYSEKNYESLSLPFLCLHLNHSHLQDINVMEYQKKCKAGLINQAEIAQITRRLQCVIASLKTANIINQFATLINLPEDLPHPRKTLLLLLNFIDTITFFNQHKRETIADTTTGEIFIKTHPEDIELAFNLLKNSLFRRADELSTNARGFYVWLQKYLKTAETNQFTALDVRKARRIHPRTLSRYLQELTIFNYIEITGGNKYRGGYHYKITNFDEDNGLNISIETALKKTIETIKTEYKKILSGVAGLTFKEEEKEKNEEGEEKNEGKTAESKTDGQSPLSYSQNAENQTETSKTTQKTETEQETPKRTRQNDKENYTLKILLEQEQGQEFTITDVMALTKRSQIMETHYLKTLWEQGKLNREKKGRHFYYTLATGNNLQNVDNQIEISKTTQITENV